MKITPKLRTSLKEVKKRITEIFREYDLEKMARATSLIQRSTSKLTGKDFFQLITIEMLENPRISLPGMCDILQQLNPNASMTGQALSNRINSDGAVAYLKEVFQTVLTLNLEPIREKVSMELFDTFCNVFLEDSTQCLLNEKLADKFRGSGGSASKSALKLHYVHEFKTNSICEVSLLEGRCPDQNLGDHIFSHLGKGDLSIRDLGYFSLIGLEKIEQVGAFYLSRLSKSAAICLSEDGESINIVNYLKKRFPNKSVIDLDVFLGEKKRLPTRLIAYKLPEEVVNRRRQKAYKQYKKKGKTPSKEYLQSRCIGRV